MKTSKKIMTCFICIAALVFLFMVAGCSKEPPNQLDSSSQPDKGAANAAFLSSMGCNDQNCMDASHYHNCPADCTDYDHYHNCALGCTETSHHHSSQTDGNRHEEHHNDSHR